MSLLTHQARGISDARSNFTSAAGMSQTSAETTMLVVHDLHTKAPARYPFISKHEINYVHEMLWSVES